MTTSSGDRRIADTINISAEILLQECAGGYLTQYNHRRQIIATCWLCRKYIQHLPVVCMHNISFGHAPSWQHPWTIYSLGVINVDPNEYISWKRAAGVSRSLHRSGIDAEVIQRTRTTFFECFYEKPSKSTRAATHASPLTATRA